MYIMSTVFRKLVTVLLFKGLWGLSVLATLAQATLYLLSMFNEAVLKKAIET